MIEKFIKEWLSERNLLIPARSETLPETSVRRDGDFWILASDQPGHEFDEADRQLLWEKLEETVSDVIALTLPEGINVQVVPPKSFRNGQEVLPGLVRFTYPPPETSVASQHYWEMISDKLPEVSRLLDERVKRAWPSHLAAKNVGRDSDDRAAMRQEIVARHRQARQIEEQTKAVNEARRRLNPTASPLPPVEVKKRGRSL